MLRQGRNYSNIIKKTATIVAQAQQAALSGRIVLVLRAKNQYAAQVNLHNNLRTLQEQTVVGSRSSVVETTVSSSYTDRVAEVRRTSTKERCCRSVGGMTRGRM